MFYVGQKVVCIDDSQWGGTIKNNNVYTIKDIFQLKCSRLRFKLEEVEDICNCGFFSDRFRPLEEKKIDISILTALLNPVNHKQLEDA